jgi:hypothetical protein
LAVKIVEMRRIQPIPDEWMAEAQQKLSGILFKLN